MLRRLRIKGFKSFADPVNLEFGPGLNVIVGPNGSGKSNVSDAIAWAFGEQRAGHLRAPAMHDVLFSGGEGRPPVGMAEVVVTLEGDMLDGPAEMAVSRRLTGAGESGYRLNGSSVRLVDVLDSLSTQGLGPQSLSIIRQGQVEVICQSKPSELRAILDEAAGTGLPKRRRHRAELRLKHVDQNLARARDLAGELTSRARSLERQARAAERAAEVEADLTQARAALVRARAVAAGRELADARRACSTCAGEVTAATAAADAARSAVVVATEERGRVVRERDGAVQTSAGLRGVSERLVGRAEVATGRVAVSVDEFGRRGQRRREAREALVAAEAAALEAEITRQQVEEAARHATEELEQAEATHQRAVAERERTRESHRLAEAEAVARGAVDGRIIRATEAIATLDVAGGPDLLRAERRAEIVVARRTRDAERSAAAGRDADSARSARAGVAARAARLTAEAVALAHGDERPVEGVVLGDGIEVQDGMERAVAAALGDLADAPLLGSVDDGIRALRSGAVAAAVAPPAPGKGFGAPPTPGAQPVSDLVIACPGRARPWLDEVLRDAWLVPSLTDLPPGIRARVLVTAEGLAFRPDLGMLTGVRGPWAGRVLHTRALERAEHAASQLGDVERAEELATEIERRSAGRARITARAAEESEARLVSLRAEDRRRATLRAEAVAALDSARAELARLGPPPESEPIAPEVSEDAARAARVVRDAAAETSRLAHLGAAQERARAEGIVARRARARAEVETPDTPRADLSEVLTAAEALSAVATALARRADDMDNRSRSFADVITALDATVSQAEMAAEHAGRVDAGAAAADRAAEVAFAVADERAREAGVAEGAPEPPPPAEDDEPADTIADRVESLALRRAGMGAVNSLAADDHVELVERGRETGEVVTDLELAAAALRTQMDEIDAQVAGGFAEVMTAVDERFQEVVGLLFPGGTGRLRVVSDDGEDGVEVEVVPAGKRARSLGLFSGGEKSLIALAFCLAIAMARPTPFYLLDEVDAALDDANLRRFLSVLRRLSGERQFILITHQQPTVEIADLLFGVTMGRSGVSQVVSRRLGGDAEGPARPWVRRHLQEARGSDASTAAAG